MSTPAQKPRPSAARITARVAGSAPAAATAAARSRQPCTGSALTGGKSMTTSAIPSAVRTPTLIGFLTRTAVVVSPLCLQFGVL